MNQRETGHGEEPAPCNGESNEQQVLPTTEGQGQQSEDEHGGDGNGQETVGLDLPGIAHSNDGTASEVNVYVGVGGLCLVGTVLQEVYEATVVIGLAIAER